MSNKNTIQLLTIYFDSTTHYFTTAQRDFDYNGNTYIAGVIKPITKALPQTQEIKNTSNSIEFSAVDQSVIALFDQNEYTNRQCVIHEYDLDTDQVSIYQSSSMINVQFVGKETTSVINLKLATNKGSLNAVAGLDLGLLYSEWINDDQSVYWGKKADTTSSSPDKVPAPLDPRITTG